MVELSPFEFLDRLADLVPPPRKHRHRYHDVFAPDHRLRRAVTALAIGNIGTRGEDATGGHAPEGCCDTHAKPHSAAPGNTFGPSGNFVGVGLPMQCARGVAGETVPDWFTGGDMLAAGGFCYRMRGWPTGRCS